jgi:polysaccharide export outer membrane protein
MNTGNFARLTLCAMGAIALSACSADRATIGGDPQLSVMPGNELPRPSRSDLSIAAPPYFIGPLDRLIIDVFGVEELSQREVQVDASGRLSFPLAGVVDVSGMTPGEVEADLARRLAAAHVRNPQVTVNLKETVSQVVTVEGQVRKPGVYPVLGQMSLLRAVATAEGTDEFSRLSQIVVFRTVQGQRYAALYDLKAIREGAYPDPQIFAGDVVMVGESRSRRLFKDLLQTVPLISGPLVIALSRN